MRFVYVYHSPLAALTAGLLIAVVTPALLLALYRPMGKFLRERAAVRRSHRPVAPARQGAPPAPAPATFAAPAGYASPDAGILGGSAPVAANESVSRRASAAPPSAGAGPPPHPAPPAPALPPGRGPTPGPHAAAGDAARATPCGPAAAAGAGSPRSRRHSVLQSALQSCARHGPGPGPPCGASGGGGDGVAGTGWPPCDVVGVPLTLRDPHTAHHCPEAPASDGAGAADGAELRLRAALYPPSPAPCGRAASPPAAASSRGTPDRPQAPPDGSPSPTASPLVPWSSLVSFASPRGDWAQGHTICATPPQSVG